MYLIDWIPSDGVVGGGEMKVWKSGNLQAASIRDPSSPAFQVPGRTLAVAVGGHPGAGRRHPGGRHPAGPESPRSRHLWGTRGRGMAPLMAPSPGRTSGHSGAQWEGCPTRRSRCTADGALKSTIQ